MKIRLIVLTTVLLVSMLTAAHDPKEHVEESSPPDCLALVSMDHENMNMDDPVMKAMFAKCEEVMQGHGDNDGKDKHNMDMKNTPIMKDIDHDDYLDDHDHG